VTDQRHDDLRWRGPESEANMVRITLALALVISLSGCANSMLGAVEAARSLGGGILDDAQGMLEGGADRYQQLHQQQQND